MTISFFVVTLTFFSTVWSRVDNTLELALDISPPNADAMVAWSYEDQVSFYSKMCYTTKILVGYPPVSEKFVISTTSSYFWINQNSAQPGKYHFDRSVTGHKLFYTPFVTDCHGILASEMMMIDDLRFRGRVWVTNSTENDQKLGLGYLRNANGFTQEASWVPPFLELLKSRNLIRKEVYSLWLRNNTGSLLFGGYDKSRYAGDLSLVPIVGMNRAQDHVNPRNLSVMLHGIRIYNNKYSVAKPFMRSVILDITTAKSLFPWDMIYTLRLMFGGKYSRKLKALVIPCNVTGTITLYLSGVEINVKVEDMLLPIYSNSMKKQCLIMVESKVQGQMTLGLSFLQSLYMVFDMELNQVAIAEAADDPIDVTRRIVAAEPGVPLTTMAPKYDETPEEDIDYY